MSLSHSQSLAEHSHRPFHVDPIDTSAQQTDSDDDHDGGGGDEEEGVPSFRDGTYQSSEMRRLLMLREPEPKTAPSSGAVNYRSSDVFPDWVLANSMWKNAPKTIEKDNEISEILKIPVMKRTQEQVSTLIHWLMSVWGIANTMGYKRCGAMFKEFKYTVFEAGENIIKEGERGLTFYIIISGTTTVHKEGIGTVGTLTKGKSFGEIALTQGKDLRTATVTATTKVEVLSLHKHDYDYFVRDLQEMERRENFQILSQCTLFKSWPKGKIEKICNTCLRKTYEAGSYIFRQGDPPDDLFVVVEGTVNIFKELVIVCKNRWPVDKHKWKQRVHRLTQPIMLKALQRGSYFGEVAILKGQLRSTSAIAATRCVLISLDKLEFLHSVQTASAHLTSQEEEDEIEKAIRKYIGDDDVFDKVGDIKGGPSSAAYVGGVRIRRNDSTAPRPSTTSSGRSFTRRSPSPSSVRAGRPVSSPSGSPTRSPRGSPVHVRISPDAQEEGVVKDDQIAEQMRRSAMSMAAADRSRRSDGFDFAEVFNAKHERRTARSPKTPTPVMVVRDSREKVDTKRRGQTPNKNLPGSNPRPPPDSSPPTTSQGKSVSGLRNKVDAVRRNSMSFIIPNKRKSLAGIDNDNGSYVFDPNKIVLRKNSVIRIGMVYEHIYQKLQAETMHAVESASEKKERPHLMRKASVLLSNTLRLSFDGGTDQAVGMGGGVGGGSRPVSPVRGGQPIGKPALPLGDPSFESIDDIYDQNPLLFKLARRESVRRMQLPGGQSQSAKATSPKSPKEHDDAPTRRGSRGLREPKFLGKSKISYRDAIQG